jgi:hypothetical protein
MADQIQPGQNQDDELDVDELEEASGGVAELADDNINGTCPNTNCPCSA